VLAIVEQLASRMRRRSVITRHPRASLTSAGFDFMAVLTIPEKHLELEQRASDKVRRVSPEDGARPDGDHLDLDARTVRITRRRA